MADQAAGIRGMLSRMSRLDKDGLMTDETQDETMPKPERREAICQCGAVIESYDDTWSHALKTFDEEPHKPTPLTNQPPPEGHENFDYLQQRFQEELNAQEHLKQGQVDKRVEAYEEHVREIESPGYVSHDLPNDTLGEWIYNRLRQQMPDLDTPWADLGKDDQDFWVHEARAYRRAAARDGFKDYNPLMSSK